MTKARQLAVGDQSPHNFLINGGFDVWQRGTSQSNSSYGSDDRWTNNDFGSTKTHSRQAFVIGQTDVPGNPEFYSRSVVTSVDDAGDNYVRKEQRIEGVHTLSGKTATFTFYAKANAAKVMSMDAYQHFGTGGTVSPIVYVTPKKIALTTSWQKFSMTFAIPSIAGKTVGTNGDSFLAFRFWFDAGANYNAQTDSLGNQSGTFDIARVSVCEGNVTALDDPFDERSVGEELALCQRYFQWNPCGPASFSGTSNQVAGGVALPAALRATPSITVVNGASAIDEIYAARRNLTGGLTIYDDSPSNVPKTSYSVTGGCSAGTTANASGVFMAGHWSLDAEL